MNTNNIKYNITLTPLAIEKAKEAISKRGEQTKGIRFGLRGGKCNGFEFLFEFVDKIKSTDYVFSFDAAIIIMDPKSLVLLNGTIIDYETKLMSHGFKFDVPNKKGECSCGSSINFK